MQILRYGSPTYKVLDEVANWILLSFCTLLSSLPIVTWGPSFLALFDSLLQAKRGENISIKQYFRLWKKNAKQGFLLGFFFLLLFIFLSVDLLIVIQHSFHYAWIGLLWKTFFSLFLALMLVLYFYLSVQMLLFEQKFFLRLRNAVVLAFTQPKATAKLFFMHVIPWGMVLFLPTFALYTLPLWLFLFPAVLAEKSLQILLGVYSRYLPEDYLKTEEDEGK